MLSFTEVSGNRKTGPIPTTMTERSSCPTTCPFYDKGCYAKTGHTVIHWRRLGAKGFTWNEFIHKVKSLPKGQLWRHNVAGDLPHNDGVINYTMLRELMQANKGKKGFTYTHHDVSIHENHVAIETANLSGFTVNVSTESVEAADKIMSHETHPLPAVAVINSAESRRFFKTSSGRQVVVCPATIHDNVTCNTCGLCQKADRKFIIAFPAHGVAKKTVNSIVS